MTKKSAYPLKRANSSSSSSSIYEVAHFKALTLLNHSLSHPPLAFLM